jgi:glycosyltransferase involved in cell wall biosynthesis
MDGLEWKRSKYSPTVQRFLKYAEKLAVTSSDLLVADSEVIQEYLSQTYKVQAVFIPYGAEISEIPGPENLSAFDVSAREYYLLIARMQADNHVEEIIQGVLRSNDQRPLLVVGNVKNKHGEYLCNRYASDRIRFPGSIFDQSVLNLLRYHSRLYFHGHSAGGTNPSLLEAMAARALVCAHDNPFNRSVLRNNALFFHDPDHIAFIIDREIDLVPAEAFRANNLLRLRNNYTWDLVIDAYHKAFRDLVKK